MNKKYVSALLGLGLFIALKWLKVSNDGIDVHTEQVNNLKSNLNHSLVFTKHAECRMKCRNISEEEVRDVAENGKINSLKSDPSGVPCPTVAKEKRSRDGQEIRVVLADCKEVTKIVTVIDLDREHRCDCK